MKYNTQADVSAMTNIKQKYLMAINNCVEYSIADAVWETASAGDSIAEIDVGFGTLHIAIGDNAVRCRIKLNGQVSKTIAKSLENFKAPTEPIVEKDLNDRIEETYKELFH